MSKADRFNEGKPKLSLVNLNSLEDCARVLEYGTEKYDRDNWRKGLVFSEVLDSMLRHIAEIQEGRFIDEESGLSHIGHIQANAMFLGSGVYNDIINGARVDTKNKTNYDS